MDSYGWTVHCFRRIDIDDLPLTKIHSFQNSPYCYIHSDVVFERYRVSNECSIVRHCSPSSSQLGFLPHWFCFQNPLCVHTEVGFLDRAFEHFIFGETEWLRTNPDLRFGSLLVLSRCKEFYFQHIASLQHPRKFCFACVKVYTWEFRKQRVTKITFRTRCLKRGRGPSLDLELGTTISWTIRDVVGFRAFRKDGPQVVWEHLLYGFGPKFQW